MNNSELLSGDRLRVSIHLSGEPKITPIFQVCRFQLALLVLYITQTVISAPQTDGAREVLKTIC